MSEDRSKPLDTVRLDAGASERLMNDLDRASEAGASSVKANRRGLRVGYRPGMVQIDVTQPSGDLTRYSVMPRNLSAWGMGFIHGRFVYPTSRVVVALVKRDRQAVAVRGVVVHCRHLMGLLHEVAMRFDAPIDLASYVELSPAAARRALTDAGVGEEEACGTETVLVVAGRESQTLAAELREAGLAVRQEDAQSAGRSLKEGNVAAVIVAADENAGDTPTLLAGWRESGFAGAVLVLMREGDEQAEARALEAGANAVLTRPQGAADVLEWLRRLTKPDAAAGPGESKAKDGHGVVAAGSAGVPALWPNAQALRENLQSGDKGLMELIDAFTTSLSEQARRLEAASDENDFETVMELCKAVEAAGASFGQERLTKACRWTLSVLAEQAGEVHVIRQSVRNLLAEMRRKMR